MRESCSALHTMHRELVLVDGVVRSGWHWESFFWKRKKHGVNIAVIDYEMGIN